jgi:hypothetical protein
MLLDTLHLVAADRLADGFYAASTRHEEQWLLPIDREGLGRVKWGEVLDRASGSKLPGFLAVSEKTDDKGEKLTGGDRVVEVRIEHGGQRWERAYPLGRRQRELGAGNALDLRIWPNFLLAAAPLLPQHPEDRVYFFRIRQQADWNLKPLALVRMRDDEGRVTGVGVVRLEVGGGVVPTGLERYRRAVFYWLPAEQARFEDGSVCPRHVEPIGLYFENRGLLLFRLKPARAANHLAPIRWRVGVDFGTTNTCVAYRPLDVDGRIPPRVEPFAIQTAVMHAIPTYPEVRESNKGMESEGAAAIFDFPYCYAAEALLTEQFYFPSQLISRLAEPPEDAGFHFEHGFILLRNPVLDNGGEARELLNNLPPLVTPDHRVFRVIQDLKWSNAAYRRVFLWHLYKLLVLQAARHGATVVEIAFSFPRAFSPNAVKSYSTEALQIFQHYGGIPVRHDHFVSESVAVQRRIEAEDASADRLVLDVGGGTTDVTGLLIAAESCQASYALSAGYVNQFFQASPALRKVLCQAAEAALGEPADARQHNKRRLLGEILGQLGAVKVKQLGEEQRARIASYSQAAFFGLLGLLEDRHLPPIAQALLNPHATREPSERKAITGYFLTLTLLYTSVAYQAARLLSQHRRPSPNIEFIFIGNGSRYLRLLEGHRQVFRHLLERLVKTAWPATSTGSKPPLTVKTRLAELGKAYVAEGLVLGCESVLPAEVLDDRDAVQQFEALTAGREAGRVVTGRELREFVSYLTALLPSGRWQESPTDEIPMVPFCEAELDGLLGPLVKRAVAVARDLVWDNAQRHAEWQQAADEARRIQHKGQEHARREAARAVEPVFVTSVRCLLDEVRREYAV